MNTMIGIRFAMTSEFEGRNELIWKSQRTSPRMRPNPTHYYGDSVNFAHQARKAKATHDMVNHNGERKRTCA